MDTGFLNLDAVPVPTGAKCESSMPAEKAAGAADMRAFNRVLDEEMAANTPTVTTPGPGTTEDGDDLGRSGQEADTGQGLTCTGNCLPVPALDNLIAAVATAVTPSDASVSESAAAINVCTQKGQDPQHIQNTEVTEAAADTQSIQNISARGDIPPSTDATSSTNSSIAASSAEYGADAGFIMTSSSTLKTAQRSGELLESQVAAGDEAKAKILFTAKVTGPATTAVSEKERLSIDRSVFSAAIKSTSELPADDFTDLNSTAASNSGLAWGTQKTGPEIGLAHAIERVAERANPDSAAWSALTAGHGAKLRISQVKVAAPAPPHPLHAGPVQATPVAAIGVLPVANGGDEALGLKPALAAAQTSARETRLSGSGRLVLPANGMALADDGDGAAAAFELASYAENSAAPSVGDGLNGGARARTGRAIDSAGTPLSVAQLLAQHGAQERQILLPAAARLPVFSPQFDNLLSNQSLWQAQQNMQVAELQLDPVELGPIQIRIQQQGNETSIQFNVSHATTREHLEQALPRLREVFQAGGLQLLNVDVQDGRRESPAQAQGQEQSHASRPVLPRAALAEERSQRPISVNGVVDGRIDAFA